MGHGGIVLHYTLLGAKRTAQGIGKVGKHIGKGIGMGAINATHSLIKYRHNKYKKHGYRNKLDNCHCKHGCLACKNYMR